MGDYDDDATGPEQRSKFEWRPEDITILKPGDTGYGDDFDDDQEEDEPTTASTMEGTEP
jgi:hypothetical protein